MHELKRTRQRRSESVLGCVIGGAIGDALGYQIEFEKMIKEKQVTRFENGHGIISDDTQMSMFTANALLNAKTKNKEKENSIDVLREIYFSYLTWNETQSSEYQGFLGEGFVRHPKSDETGFWISDIHALYKRRAPGVTCRSALSSGKMGTIEHRINDSKGCGTIMRVAPIGLMENYAYAAGELATKASAITHGHDLALIPSFLLSAMIFCLSYEFDLKSAFSGAMSCLEQYQMTTNYFEQRNIEYVKKMCNKAIGLSKLNFTDQQAIEKLGEGWVAEETFAIALYSCFKHHDSFEDAVVCAVNHDGDSDSTGAVAGNIMGAFLGINKIPEYYIQNVEMSKEILDLANDMTFDFSQPLNDRMKAYY